MPSVVFRGGVRVETHDKLLPRRISGKFSVDGLDIRFPSGMVE